MPAAADKRPQGRDEHHRPRRKLAIVSRVASPLDACEPGMTRLRSASTMWTTLLYALPLFLFALFLPHPASAGKGAPITELDRVASAVEEAESSHGSNAAMWRAVTAGPQGPRQVSQKSAIDPCDGNQLD